MKVKVIKPFKDGRTKAIYQAGQIIEVTKERYEALTSSALGTFVQAISKPEEPKKPAPQKPTTKKTTTKKSTKKK
jgi:hypothetical protein